MIWLGEKRGFASDWVTQLWVRATGREVSLDEHPWLDGPAGNARRIGTEWFHDLAESDRLAVRDGAGTRGIIPDFDCLEGPEFRCSQVSDAVRHFYENTSAYELDAWGEWRAWFRPFGWLLAALFSRRLQQLNVPLSALDTSRGLSNNVWHLVDPESAEIRHVAWVRHLVDSGKTVYSGRYGPCRIPGWPGPCLKVAFPLPNGNALVVMKPVVDADGSLLLISSGGAFGDPGFYFTVRRGDGRLAVRYVKSMRETIRVYASGPEEARADHTLRYLGVVFLRLHYRLRQRREASS